MRWLLFSLLVMGCDDPLKECQIDALGDEHPDVPVSAEHRSGQPCVLCHSPYGGATPELSLGGTIYRSVGDDVVPAPGVFVRVSDSDGRDGLVGPTNCAGNFHVPVDQLNPGYPIVVEIMASADAMQPLAKMEGRIGRDGSCATCHTATASETSAGLIVLSAELDDGGCPPMPVQPIPPTPTCTDPP